MTISSRLRASGERDSLLQILARRFRAEPAQVISFSGGAKRFPAIVRREYATRAALGIRIIISPKSLPSRLMFLASIFAMVSIFGLDLADGSKIWLHVLYVFPISAIAFCCERTPLVVIGVVTSNVLQLLTLIAYRMPGVPIAANLTIAFASGTMIAVLSRVARVNIARIEALTITDPLTGLHNRRGFGFALDREIARQKRYGGVFSVVVLDLDRFKELNDSQGHDAGDRALSLLAAVLRESTRQSDSIARLGGDEFAIVMPNTSEAECASVCRHLSTTIGSRMALADFAITASIGYATFERAPASASTALQRADLAMYAVKSKRPDAATTHRSFQRS
jgi:diguanylate cyclase (GGDEF)-like protein